jgi:hypothetical protein
MAKRDKQGGRIFGAPALSLSEGRIRNDGWAIACSAQWGMVNQRQRGTPHMNDYMQTPPSRETLLTMKNGPSKKFYLCKQYGPALKAKGCHTDLRTLGCDDIMALLRGNGII